MIFRIVFLSAISACLMCASDQTVGLGSDKQPTDTGGAGLLRALKAASTESLGINRLSHVGRLGSNFTLDITPKVPRFTAPPSLLGRAGLSSPLAKRCAIPLIPMEVKPTRDAMNLRMPRAADQGMALPPPAPACRLR
jgi:hypothetical protein